MIARFVSVSLSLFTYTLILMGSILLPNILAAEAKLMFKPDYSGGQAFANNLKECTPGTFVMYNPICLSILKAGVDMENQNQLLEGRGKPLTQADVIKVYKNARQPIRLSGRKGINVGIRLWIQFLKTKSNCSVSVSELPTMAENTRKIYGSEVGVDTSASILSVGTHQCTPVKQ